MVVMRSDKKLITGLVGDRRALQVDIDPVTGNRSFFMGEVFDVTADATMIEETSYSPSASES